MVWYESWPPLDQTVMAFFVSPPVCVLVFIVVREKERVVEHVFSGRPSLRVFFFSFPKTRPFLRGQPGMGVACGRVFSEALAS